MPKISGGHAIVTGGSSGIGLAVATELVSRGTGVSLLARDPDRLEKAASGLRAGRAKVATCAVDVSDGVAVGRAIDEVVSDQGPCDLLIASAGQTHPGYFAELPPEQFRALMDVNYFGMLHAIRAVTPSMLERGQGSIVGVSSTVGLIGVYGYSAYAPTKFAVRGLLETLRAELGPRGIHVGCVFPPDTETPQLRFEGPLKPPETKAISGSIKPISAAQVARAIVKGVERDHFWIMADPQTRVLARLGGLGRGLLSWDLDRRARGARADGGSRSSRVGTHRGIGR